MPIVVAQPQPLAPQISQGYGSAQQFSQDLPTLARLYEGVAQLRASNANQSANRQQALMQQGLSVAADVAQGNANRITQFNEGNERTRLGYENLAAQAGVTPAQAYHAQAQQALSRQQYEQQLSLESSQMTQAENLRLQRLNQAAAQIQQSVDKDELTPAEGRDLLMQINTGRSPLLQKQAAYKANLEAAQADKIRHEIAQQTTMQLQNQDFIANMIKKGVGVLPWYDPETGKMHPMIQNPKDGTWYNPLQKGGGGGKEAAPKPFDITKAAKDAQAEADLAFPPTVDPITGKEVKSQENRDYARKVFGRERDAHAQGLPPAGQLPNLGVGQSGQGGTQQPQPQPDKPFDPAEPKSMNPVQARTVTAFQKADEQVQSRSDLSPAVKRRAGMMARSIVQTLADYGSLDALIAQAKAGDKTAAKDLANYQLFADELSKIPDKPKPAGYRGSLPSPTGAPPGSIPQAPPEGFDLNKKTERNWLQKLGDMIPS